MRKIREETVPYNTGWAAEMNKGQILRIAATTTVDFVAATSSRVPKGNARAGTTHCTPATRDSTSAAVGSVVATRKRDQVSSTQCLIRWRRSASITLARRRVWNRRRVCRDLVAISPERRRIERCCPGSPAMAPSLTRRRPER